MAAVVVIVALLPLAQEHAAASPDHGRSTANQLLAPCPAALAAMAALTSLPSATSGAASPIPGRLPVGDTAGPASLETAGLIASATGLELLSRGAPEAATACLEIAAGVLPGSAVVAHDLAVAYAQMGRELEALAALDRALALGDPDPEAHPLRAMLLAELGQPGAALEEVRRVPGWESDIIAAALGDDQAAYRAANVVGEETQRGALSALVLAAHAGDRGEQNTARLLDGVAEQSAQASGSPIVLNAARALDRRLAEQGGTTVAARVRATVDHTTNPEFQAEGPAVRETAFRLAFTGEGAIEIPVGTARIDGALRVDQHVFLTDREQFRGVDLTGFTAALSVEFPISYSPSAALVGVRARAIDAWGDRFHVHYATTFEGGPTLAIPLTSATRVELGIFGLVTDYIDVSPASAKISSVNRDLVGQRVALALAFRASWLEGRGELMFIRDNARGEAFDATGGAASGRLRAYPGGGVALDAGVSVAARVFGPVGDLSIIGPPATRTELRTAVDVEVRVPLQGGLALVLGDVWIQNAAHDLHGYTENVLSSGLEQSWW